MTSRPAALAADAACVVGFAVAGRSSHAEGITVPGVADTAWPFLAGVAVGHALVAGRGRPASSLPAGLVVLATTVVLGMALRRLAGDGTAVPFVVVATLVNAATLLGWRGAAAALRRSRR